MEEATLVQGPYSLSGNFSGIFTQNIYQTSEISPEYYIGGVTTFQVKVFRKMMTNNTASGDAVCIKFTKLRPDDPVTYTIKLNSEKLNVVNQYFNDDSGTWRLVTLFCISIQYFSFDINVQLDIVPGISLFAPLRNDTEMDFELRGEDGSVHLHRTALASCSPVMRRLLSGTWGEKKEDTLDVPGTSRETLEHFKDYVYLRKLPEIGLKQILLFASYYKIVDLEQRCVFKLVGSLSTQNVYELLELSVKHKCLSLLYAILDSFQRGVFNVDYIQGLEVTAH